MLRPCCHYRSSSADAYHRQPIPSQWEQPQHHRHEQQLHQQQQQHQQCMQTVVPHWRLQRPESQTGTLLIDDVY